MKKFLVGTALVLALCSSAFSYSYTAYAFTTGKQTLAVVPFLYAFQIDKDLYGGGDMSASYGITDQIDIFADVNYLYGAGAGITGWYGMLRYDFGDTKILALKANNIYVSPQFHYLVENDKCGFQANAAAQITYAYVKSPAFFGVLCPHYKLTKWMDIFCEVNPCYATLDGDVVGGWVRPQGFGLDVVPGIGLKISPELLFSLAVPIYDVNHKATPTFGMWGLYIINFGKK